MPRTLVAQLDNTKPDGVALEYINVADTTIVGRSQIPDLSKDLKPRLGIDRFQIQDKYLISGESGPNGETVYGVVNDKFDQVRFIGGWRTQNNSFGPYLDHPTTTSDYFEVTFYGTGLNMLSVSGGINVDVYVDGGGATNRTFVGANTTGNRNYTPNMPFNLCQVPLGLHTVRVENAGGGQIAISGLEIVNENVSGNIVVTEGSYHKDGITRTHTSEEEITRDTGFEIEQGTSGNKGGHVVIYIKQDGTIGKSVQWVDTDPPLYLSSADHSNEEVIAEHFWREFGAGKTDDFSLLTSTSASSYAFVLDDGTTTLIGEDVRVASAGSETVSAAAAFDFTTITFVGTGLDIIRKDSAAGAGADVRAVTIDGSGIPNLDSTGVTTERVVPIVSGLPYGTHTVQIYNDGAPTVFQMGIKSFIVYGPKKPEIPAESVELVDYFLMADFVANTVQNTHTLSTGVLRKSVSRGMIYAEGGSGTTNWTLLMNPSFYTGGFLVSSDKQGAYVEYTFFGTGFDMRCEAGGAGTYSADVTVNIDGVLADVNHPEGLSFGTYGTVSYDSSAGNGRLNTVGSGRGNGLVISGLSLGIHTVRFTQNTNADYFNMECLDIITPIHAPKLNGPHVVQNTLRVGSQGLRDLRTFNSEQVEELLNSVSTGTIATGTTNNSIADVPAPDMLATIKTRTGKIRVSYNIGFSNNLNNTGTHLSLYMDGKQIPATWIFESNKVANDIDNVSASTVVNTSPGEHTIVGMWRTSGGGSTSTLNDRRSITAEEVE